MPGRKFRVVAVLGATLIGSALLVPSAQAQTSDTTSATITAGNLTLSGVTAADFPAKGVTGTLQTATTTLADYNVSDLRGGLGTGWHLTAQATQFSDAGGTNKLPTGSLLMAAPVITPGAGNLAVTPVPGAGGLIDTASATVVANAIAGTGTGQWDFTHGPAALTLTIPANVVPATYTSTVTMTLGAAPAL